MRISEHIFENQEIVLDFAEFNHCEFKGCRLKLFGHGDFSLINCTLDDKCRIEFAGPAASTLVMLSKLRQAGFAEFVDRVLESIQNGRISDTGAEL